jgi:hypothetical protein
MKRNIALFFIVIASSFVAVQPAFAQEQQQVPTLVLISNVNIFDGKSEKLHQNMHVLMQFFVFTIEHIDVADEHDRPQLLLFLSRSRLNCKK